MQVKTDKRSAHFPVIGDFCEIFKVLDMPVQTQLSGLHKFLLYTSTDRRLREQETSDLEVTNQFFFIKRTRRASGQPCLRFSDQRQLNVSFLKSFKSRSKIQCAMYCASKIPGCTSFLYNASTGVCSIASAASDLVAHIICDAWLGELYQNIDESKNLLCNKKCKRHRLANPRSKKKAMRQDEDDDI